MSKKHRKEEKRKAAQKVKKTERARPVTPSIDQKYFWKKNLIPGLILLLVPFLLYAATYNYGYVLDDKIVLSENNFVKKGIDGIGDIFTNEVFTGYLGEQQDLVAGGRYRPLSLVAFAVEYEMFGDKPGLFHLFNVLWYALLGLLIFRILGMLFATEKKQWFFTIPFLATLFFVLHPIHVEAVANIKGRDEIMTFTLALASMYFVLRYIQRPGIVGLIAAGISFLLALLAKENAITFLAVIPLTLYMFTNASWKDMGKVMTPLLTATIVYLVIRYNVIGYFLDSGKEVTGLMNDPFRDMTGGQKYATIFYTLWRYIGLLFFPHPLTHDYYPYHIPIIGWNDIRSIGPFFLYLIIGIYAVINMRKKRHVPAYSILFFLITLSITSNFVFSVGTFMNERFAFMPSLGFTLLVAYWLVNYIPWKIGNTKPAFVLTAALIFILMIGYTYKTTDRIPAWKDPMSLNLTAVKVSKNSARINNFMGFEYYKLANAESDREKKKQYLDEATVYMDRAIEIHPTYPDALMGKAGLLAGYYGIDRDLQKLLDGFYKILRVRQVTYIDTYLEYLNKRGANPQMTNFYHHTGNTLFMQEQRNLGLAAKYLNYGIQLDPNSPILNEDLCIYYYLQGNKQQALSYGLKALQLDPTRGEARKYVDLIQQSN